MKRILKYTLPVLFFAFICRMIFMADLNQENLIMTIGHAIPSGDKIGHFLIFGLMAFLLNNALRFREIQVWKYSMYLGSVLVMAFAVTEEFSQLFFESRSFDWVDVVFDTWGVIWLSGQKFRRFLRMSSIMRCR